MVSLLKGKIETLNGVKVYVATPEADYPKDKVLLYLPDVFGIELVNNKVGLNYSKGTCNRSDISSNSFWLMTLLATDSR